MTHDDLVRRAVQWLKKPSKNRTACGVVVPELVAWFGEQPDAIGWNGGGYSTMIECKVSHADFLADKKKPRQLKGVGSVRYYMCQPGVIRAEELPPYWGLLYCHEKRITVEVDAPYNANRDMKHEISMMYSLLRRVEIRGQLTRCLSPKWGGDVGTEPVAQQKGEDCESE